MASFKSSPDEDAPRSRCAFGARAKVAESRGVTASGHRRSAAVIGRATGFILLIAAALAIGDNASTAAPAGGASATRSVTLTLTKADNISLPVDVRDVLVADPTVADVVVKTPRLVYLIGAKIGQTNAFFLDGGGRQVLQLNIKVERDLSALRDAIAALAPTADVKVAAVNEDIVLTGSVPSAEIAENVRQLARRFVAGDNNIVSMVQISGHQQVLIRVRVAEVNRTVTKKLGFNLFFQGNGFTFQSGAAPQNSFIPDRFGFASSLGAGSGVNSVAGVGTVKTTSGDFGLASGAANYSNLATLGQNIASYEALESDGLIKTLAEPNLTSTSGEAANFLVGGEFPVPTGLDQNGNILITFKQFGISLAFTPVVLSSGRINLKILSEVSALSDQGAISIGNIQVPALKVRRAQTTVEMPSGGSLVLAGLLQNDALTNMSGLPGIKDVPILGALFRSTALQRNETELVVVATPLLVRPTSPDQLPLPTDGFGNPNDLDLFLLDGLYSRYGAVRAVPAKPEAGRPIGYIMK
ncbi:MAG: BON domain-containing protein [Azospirillum sp.]|nr:BON domain-containing protein [Azospirillum sp.]